MQSWVERRDAMLIKGARVSLVRVISDIMAKLESTIENALTVDGTPDPSSGDVSIKLDDES